MEIVEVDYSKVNFKSLHRRYEEAGWREGQKIIYLFVSVPFLSGVRLQRREGQKIIRLFDRFSSLLIGSTFATKNKNCKKELSDTLSCQNKDT